MSEAVSHDFPNDVDALKELLIGKIQRIDKLDKQVQQLSQLVFLLQEEKRLAKAARFGPSSEIHPG